MQVKSIAECSEGSILQYFQPSLSYHLSLRSLFCLFLSGRLRQALLLKHYFIVEVEKLAVEERAADTQEFSVKLTLSEQIEM